MPADRDVRPTSAPIVEDRPDGEAILEPSRRIGPHPRMPEAVVLCFFTEVLRAVGNEADELARLTWEHGVHPIYRLETPEGAVGVMHPGVGAPMAAGMLEGAIAYGGRRFVAAGGCGVLVPELTLGHVIVPTAAIRDEGTSYHYLPAARTIDLDPEVTAPICRVLDAAAAPYVTGTTWTTDAPYRETRAVVDRRRAEGAIAVEMECSAFAAVARFRGVRFGQILYAGDDLSGEEHDNRGWQRAKDIRRRLFDLAVRAALAT